MNHHLLPLDQFFKKMIFNLLVGLAIVIGSLGIGMVGYAHFEKMNWVDAYENAAMILSGMGPVAVMQTTGGKLFAGSYALFSGVIFLVVIAIIIAPIFHRFLHHFLVKDN